MIENISTIKNKKENKQLSNNEIFIIKGRYLFAEIIKVAPFEEEINFQKAFFFSFKFS